MTQRAAGAPPPEGGGNSAPDALHRQDRADLHGAAVGGRALGGVRDGLMLVLGLDHVEADDLVTTVRERPRGRLRGPVPDPNRLGRLRSLYGIAGFEHAL